MKNNKFCISRTLVYLILLIVAVVGGFYVVSRMNAQNLSSKPQAAGVKCIYVKQQNSNDTGDKACARLSSSYNTNFVYYASGDQTIGGTKIYCCVPIPTDKNKLPDKIDPTVKAQAITTCQSKANQIAEKYKDGSCAYYTGGYYIDKNGYVVCTTKTTDDHYKCLPQQGTPITTSTPDKVREICSGLKEKVVPNTVVEVTGRYRQCLVYTGYGITTGNQLPNLTPDASGFIRACKRVYKIDTWDSTNSKYSTDYCDNEKIASYK